jgi:capsular exopolysaccharide synthesis family protein
MGEHARYTSLRDYLRVLREQRLLIVLVIAIAVGTALVLSLLQEKQYESTASLVIQDETQDVEILGGAASPRLQPFQLTAQVAETIERSSIVRGVKRRLDTNRSLSELRNALTPTVEPNSNLLQLIAKDPDPAGAAAIANAFAEEAIQVSNAAVRERYAEAANDLRRQIRGLSRADAVLRFAYTSQLARLESLAEVAQTAETAETARPSEDPVSPKVIRNAIFGLLAGIALGLLAAFLRDSLDRRLRTSADVLSTLHMPLLGNIGKDAMGRTVSIGGDATDAGVDLEAFRIMRRNLEFLDVDTEVKTVAVTSAQPEEGKSTVAASLALASAASGKRTLLLDCDLRRPILAERLGGNPSPGLTDHLVREAAPEEIVQVVQFDHRSGSPTNGSGPTPLQFAVVTAGTPTSQPSELLGSQRFKDVLAKVRPVYDLIILDTAPLLPVVDTLEIVPEIDGVILCVRVGRTTRDQAESAKSVLDHFPPRPTGLVVTGTGPHDDRSYGGYMSYYRYAHTHERDLVL